MSDVFRTERIEQAFTIEIVEISAPGNNVSLERTAMNEHVSFPQAEAAVNQRDQQFAGRTFAVRVEALIKPLVQFER
jgi:hypothetical protein